MFSTSVPTSSDIDPTATPKVRVLLVEDHPVTRHGLKTLIDQQLNLAVVGEADSSREAMELLPRLEPDLAVIDVSLKDANGIELVREMKMVAPHLLMLVVSMHDEALFAERALRAGAMGYVMKHEAGERIVTAIQHLLRGELYLSAKMKDRALHRFVNKRSDGVVFAMDTLSNREMEVFQLIGNGFSTRQIAEKLGLSAKTIDSYREHLKLKLGLESGSDLMRHAIQWARTEIAV